MAVNTGKCHHKCKRDWKQQIQFYRRVLRIRRTEQISNEEVLKKRGGKVEYILKIRNTLEISGTHTEERRIRKFSTQRAY